MGLRNAKRSFFKSALFRHARLAEIECFFLSHLFGTEMIMNSQGFLTNLQNSTVLESYHFAFLRPISHLHPLYYGSYGAYPYSSAYYGARAYSPYYY